ncbi:hypothetical protein ACLOAU_24345 [Niabella sp. CJ426]|uniref:hypothetical protein n=1 Tax=Niabella sp. CJ426 TaxID=3393740 RepID=UPI003D020917
MKAFQKLSCIVAIVALFSCTKTIVEEQKPEVIEPPEAVMTLPGHSEISSGYISLDPVDGHYKSALFDFGPQLTHPSSGYLTGQAGVGISSMSARDEGLSGLTLTEINSRRIYHLYPMQHCLVGLATAHKRY